jgi:hypothetical protein
MLPLHYQSSSHTLLPPRDRPPLIFAATGYELPVAEAQSAALAREVNELKEAVGEQFQGYLRLWVGHLRDFVGFLKDNSDWLVKFGEAAIFDRGPVRRTGSSGNAWRYWG